MRYAKVLEAVASQAYLTTLSTWIEWPQTPSSWFQKKRCKCIKYRPQLAAVSVDEMNMVRLCIN